MTRDSPNASETPPAGGGGPAAPEVFERHRGLLFSIAYRMLGSVADAEDVVQEAFLRWRRATPGEIRSPRAFLVTVVSRLCINHRQSARVRRAQRAGARVTDPGGEGAGR